MAEDIDDLLRKADLHRDPTTTRPDPLLLACQEMHAKLEEQRKILDSLLALVTTHRHGYRWEPTDNDGVPCDQVP